MIRGNYSNLNLKPEGQESVPLSREGGVFLTEERACAKALRLK